MAIEARHYQETRNRLKQDPIVLELASELWAGMVGLQEEEFYHEDGTPTAWFMGAATAEYRRRGGEDGGHLGAVAEALWALKPPKGGG